MPFARAPAHASIGKRRGRHARPADHGPPLQRPHVVPAAAGADARATGRSGSTTAARARAPPRPASVADFAADALAVLDAAGAERAHVYGVSMGGGIAAEFAMRHPTASPSLILGCTMMKTEETPAGLAGAADLPPAAQVVPRASAWPHDRRRRMARRRRPRPSPTTYRCCRGALHDAGHPRRRPRRSAAYATTREAVARLAMPALVLHGDEDRAVDVKYGREFAAAIPGADLMIFPGAGHNYLVAAGPQSTAGAAGVPRGRRSPGGPPAAA